MEQIHVPKATLEKLQELLSIDEYINNNDLNVQDPITQLLVLALHQRELLEYQNSMIHDMKDKQLLVIDYLKQLNTKHPEENLPVLINELEEDYKGDPEEEDYEEGENNQSQRNEQSQPPSDQKEKDYKAMQEFHDVEHSYANNPININTGQSPPKTKNKHRRGSNKVELDPVLAKVAHGDEEIKDHHLLDNPDKGDIEPLMDPLTHTYTYRELSAILREQQHTVADFMYKLFLVSINFAKIRQAKSYPVFKSLLHRVKVNS